MGVVRVRTREGRRGTTATRHSLSLNRLSLNLIHGLTEITRNDPNSNKMPGPISDDSITKATLAKGLLAPLKVSQVPPLQMSQVDLTWIQLHRLWMLKLIIRHCQMDQICLKVELMVLTYLPLMMQVMK